MKRQAYLLRMLLPGLAAALLIGLVWSLLAAGSALAQHIDAIPPVANAGPDQAVSVGSTVTLDGSGSYDPDNELPLSYLWTQTGGPAVAFTPTLSVTAFTAPAVPTVLTFTLVVTDSTGMPDPTPDEVVIRVLGQPVANDDSGVGFMTDANTAFLTADVLNNDIDPGGSPLSVLSFDTSVTLGLVDYGHRAGDLNAAGIGAPNGYVTIDFGSNYDTGYDLAIQPDGKIVIAGRRNTTDSFTVARTNSDGSLDATFGTGGIVVMNFDGYGGEFSAVALQTDGKIVAAGDVGYSNFAVARLSPDGSLDNSFGTGGKVTTGFAYGYDDIASAIVIQTDGKIVVAGTTSDDNTGISDIAIARYNPDGSLDSTFGTGGKVITDFKEYDRGNDMAIQPDGKLIIAGSSGTASGSSSDFLVVRYNPDGSLDATFGDSGKVFTDFDYGDYCFAVTVYDNQIIAAGEADDVEGYSSTALARYNPNGSLDPTFGENGKVTTKSGTALDLAIQADGKIVLLEPGFWLARYKSDGRLDPTFGENGIAPIDFGGYPEAQALVIQPDGMIVATGGLGYGRDAILAGFLNQGDGTFKYDPNRQFAFLAPGEVATDTFTYVVTNGVLTDTAIVSITIIGGDTPPVAVDDRGPAFTTDEDTPFLTGNVLANDYDLQGQPLSVQSFNTSGTLGLVTWGGGPAGSLDTAGFNPPNGYLTIDFGNLYSEAHAVAIQTNGKVIVAGRSCDYECGNQDFGLARYNTDGSLDTTFGNNGKVTTDFGDTSEAYAVAIQTDGKIIAAGYTWSGGGDFALARYNPDGSLDASFGNSGKVTTDFGHIEFIEAIAIQMDGGIAAVGFTDYGGGARDFTLAYYNPDGSLDTTFGTGGKVITNFGKSDTALDVAIQPDGKIVAAGYTYADDYADSNFALARYNLDGSLDNAFGNGGKVITDLSYGSQDYAYAIALQSDGKIVATGEMVDLGYNKYFVLARYNPNGSLDNTFGNDIGVVITYFSNNAESHAVVIQPDGKIVAAGSVDNPNGSDLALARYNLDGSLDNNFGDGGKVVTDLGGAETIQSIALQSDGKIGVTGYNLLARYMGGTGNGGVFNYNPNGQFETLAAGEVATDTFTYVVSDGVLTDTATVSITITGVNDSPVAVNDRGPAFTTNEDTAFVTGDVLANDYDPEGQPLSVQSFNTTGTRGLVTINAGGGAPPGSLDVNGFGAPNGYVNIPLEGYSDARGVIIQSDQKIVVGGTVNNPDNPDFYLARFNTDGSIDQTFGNAGIVTTDFSNNDDIGNALAIQPDGKMIVAGSTYNGNDSDFALARYNPDGSLDDTFGTGGKVTTNFGNYDFILDLAIHPNGKIVAVGYMTNGSNDDFAVVQYNPDGSLDTTFGVGGLVRTDFGQQDYARAVAIHNDQIIVAGHTEDYMGENCDFALARYNPDGSLDTTFGNGGKVTTDFAGGTDMGMKVAIQADGLIIVAGDAGNSVDYDFGLARYMLDGNLDPTFGNDGRVITDLGSSDGITGLAIQSNGQIVSAGYTFIDSITVFTLARYNPDGSLDTNFGIDGIGTTNIGNNQANAMTIQSDGKIVMTGAIVLARFIGQDNGGAFTYDPNSQFETLAAGEVATDTFTYVVSDGVLTDTATVSITITGVNDPPVAVDDSGPGFTTRANTPFITGDVTFNDQDIDGDPLTVSSFDASGARGLVTFNNDGGTFTYDPNGQFNYLAAGEAAIDTFTYVVTDGVLTDTATVSITVTGVNDPPQFTSTPITTAVSMIPYTYTVTTADPDTTDILTITAPTLPEWLTLTDHRDRTAALSGTPSTPGSYPVVLAVTDGLASATQAFTITVSPSPANPVADLSVTQAFQWTSSSSGVFTLTVTNLGPDAAPGAVVSDTFPANFASVTWTCVGSGGVTCTTNGTGNLFDSLASFPAGGVVTYTVTVGEIRLASWTNTAAVIAPSGVTDPDLANNQATFKIELIFLPVIFRQYMPPGP